MADNVTIPATGSGDATPIIATDDVTSIHYQRVKLVDGVLGNTTAIAAGGGVESGALRVTLASDSTGVVSVDDNGSSLTVDNAALAVVGGGTEATALRVTLASDSTGLVSVDDNGGALTVDNGGTFVVQENGAALTALQLIDDPVATLGTTTYTETSTKGTIAGALRRDADTSAVNTDNEIAPLIVDANGYLKVEIFDGGASHTVDNNGTFATQATLQTGDNVAGRVKLSDGTDVADVLDLANSNPLTVAIVDGTGNQITSFGGGVQYTEADIDATITGTAVMWEDAADTLRVASAAKPLPVEVIAGATSGTQYIDDTSTHATGTTAGFVFMAAATPTDTSVDANDLGALAMTTDRRLHTSAAQSGTWDIANITTAVVPGTGATNLGKAVDAAKGATDTGIQMLGIRDDTLSIFSGAENDYEPLHLTAAGRLYTSATVDAALPTGSNVIGALTANQSVNAAQIAGTNTVTAGVSGLLAVGGNVAIAGAATSNPVPVGGIFQTTPATLTNGQTAELQFTAAQNIKNDVTTIAGTAPTTAGKLDIKAADGDVFVRQATASNLNAAVVGTGTAGSPAGNILTVQGVASMTKLLVTPDSVALPANQSVNVAQIAGTNTVTAGVSGLQAVGGNVAIAGAATSNPVPVGGIFQTTPATLTNGQTAGMQFTAAQNLKNDITTIAGTAPTTVGKLDVKAADGDVFVRQATAANLNATARILGNGGATLDSTVGAGSAPTNQLVVGEIFNSTAPVPTTGQAMALQADQGGNLRTFPGMGIATLAAWNNGTALNATQNIFTNSGAWAALVHLVQTSTITAGAITFEVSYDGTNWVTIPADSVLDPDSTTLAQISLPYTLVASTNKPFLLKNKGWQALRIKLSTQISGTGSVTPNYDLLPYKPGQTVIALSPTAANFNATVTQGAAGTAWEVIGDVAHDAPGGSINPVAVAGYASAAAPADVSADADVVRAWHLRNGAAACVITAAGALVGGDAANGLDVDVTRVTGTVTTTSVGTVADDGITPGSPVMTGGQAKNFDGTAPGNVSAEDDVVIAVFDRNRRQYVNTVHPELWSYHENSSSALTDTTVKGAPGANNAIYVTDIVVSTGSATAFNIFFEEGTTTTVLGPYYLEAIAGRGMAIHFQTPKKLTSATSFTVTTSAAIAHSIDVMGFVARVD